MQMILNVDDSAANRYLKTRTLRQAGFEVIEADNGADALELAAQRRPDLVLLDIKLPDMDGLEVCRRLKRDAKTQNIPVVHISATFVGEEHKAYSLDAGAEIYLTEPVGPQELTSTVRTVMRLRATERTLAENETRLRLATEGAGMATWDLGVAGNSAGWSAQFFAMLGYDASATQPSLENWLARVRADEREFVSQVLHAALRKPGALQLEHWITRANDGAERCIAVYGSMQMDQNGLMQRLLGVAMDVTERKRAELEREKLLEAARAGQRAAEETSRLKDEFLAILSHELRTPMNAVLGWIHLARSGGLPPSEHARALATVERNARLQVQLVDDLLDVSRIIAGKLEVENAVVSLPDVLRDAVESARLSAQERGVELVLRIERGEWAVRGSAQRLEQVFDNLLSNAVKFSQAKGKVEVTLQGRGSAVEISVQDQGEGIPPDVLPRVFDIFRQADSSSRRRHGGLGLGLAIVHSLVSLHGGSVAAESGGAGKGAKFTVTLPMTGEHPAARTEDAPGARSLQGLRILLVDDNADHLEMTRYILELAGAAVSTATDAQTALSAVRAELPDVVLMDLAMPDMDGFALLSALRRSGGEAGASLPAIALSGFASESHASRAATAGFHAHVAKPFDPDALTALILRVARGPAHA